MTWRVCVTTLVSDLRSCRQIGEHRPSCDGHARRYSRDLGRDIILDAECTGCQPAEAEFGFLCASHVVRLGQALTKVPELVSFLWNADTNGSADSNAGGSHAAAGPRWPLRESRVQAAWITSALRNIVRVLDDEEWDLTYLDTTVIPQAASAAQAVKIGADLASYLTRFGPVLGGTPRGAEACVRFVDLVQAALRRFPLDEKPRRIAGVRCPACGMPQLVWNPPLAQFGDVVVRCSNCTHEEGERWISQYAEIMQLREVS